MKLLLDENVPNSIYKELKRNHDVEHINQYCKGFSDDKVLSYALKNKRILVTFDSDFCKFRKQEHYGIIKICGDVLNPIESIIELLRITNYAEFKNVYFQISKEKVYKEEKLYSKKRHIFKHFKRTPIILKSICGS